MLCSFQFFRAFTKKAEDGIRIASEYSGPFSHVLFFYFFWGGCRESGRWLAPQGSPRGQLSPVSCPPADPAATVTELRRAIITNLEQSLDAWPPACPPLEPAR